MERKSRRLERRGDLVCYELRIFRLISNEVASGREKTEIYRLTGRPGSKNTIQKSLNNTF